MTIDNIDIVSVSKVITSFETKLPSIIIWVANSEFSFWLSLNNLFVAELVPHDILIIDFSILTVSFQHSIRCVFLIDKSDIKLIRFDMLVQTVLNWEPMFIIKR
jgi:hypothetical protein